MQRYFDVVQNRQGTAVVGATVTVYDSNGNLATLYSNNSNAATSNPVYTNADGEYAFYAANGTYTIQIAATGYAGETKPGVVLFDPSDSSASNDIQFLQAGTGAQVRSVQSKLRDVVSVKDFGAVGDGVTDDTTAIQNALDATDDGGELHFETGKTYLLTSGLLADNISINGNGASLISDGDFIQLQVGQLASTNAVSIPVVKYQTQIDFGISLGITVGDVVRLRSDTARLTVADYRHGYVAMAIAVVGTTVTFDRAAYDSFTIDDVDVYTKNNGVCIKNLNATQSLPSGGAGSPCWRVYGTDVLFTQCSLVGNQYSAVGIDALGVDIRVELCTFTGFLNVDGDGTGGRTGYGSQLFGNNLVWQNCRFINCKHGQITGSRSSTDVNVAVRDCYFWSRDTNSQAAIDTHAGLLTPFIVENCYVDSYERALNIRNGLAIVRNCTFIRSNSSDVASNVMASLFEATPIEILFDGCSFSNLAGNAIYMLGTNIEDPAGIKNISIINSAFSGMDIFRFDTVTLASNIVFGNNVANCPLNAVLQYKESTLTNVKIAGNKLNVAYVLEPTATVTPYTFTDIQLTNNDISLSSTSNGLFRFVDSLPTLSKLLVSNNIIDATAIVSPENAINFGGGCSVINAKFIGNTITRGGGANIFRGVVFQGNVSDRAEITGLQFQGNTLDCNLLFTDADLINVEIADNRFTTDTSAHPSVWFRILNNTSSVESVLIANNIFSSANTGLTPVIQFQGGISYTNPLLITSNVFRTSSDTAYAVVADAASTNNKIAFHNNIARRGFLDSSSTWAITPIGNEIYGVNPQQWKGSVDVDRLGRFILSAAPTTGTWAVGEIVWDTIPVAGAQIGFVCTVAGTPGTWKDWGGVSA